MKYTLRQYIRAYIKHLRTVQFWGLIWWKLTPRKIRKYFIATALIDHHEKGRAIIQDEAILEKARRFIEK